MESYHVLIWDSEIEEWYEPDNSMLNPDMALNHARILSLQYHPQNILIIELDDNNDTVNRYTLEEYEDDLKKEKI